MIFSIIFALPADASVTCPAWSGKGLFSPNAHCKMEWTLAASCDLVREEIYARVEKKNHWIDAHNQGNYANRTDETQEDRLVKLQRITPHLLFKRPEWETKMNTQFIDHINLSLEDVDGTDQCKVSGCSESQGKSLWDYSTNFCNMKVLLAGESEGYKKAIHDIRTVEEPTLPDPNVLEKNDQCAPHKGKFNPFPLWDVLQVVTPDACLRYPQNAPPCDPEAGVTGHCMCGETYCNQFMHQCSIVEGEQKCGGEPDYERLGTFEAMWTTTTTTTTTGKPWLWR